MKVVILIIGLVLLTGCVAEIEKADPYYCEVDNDCVIKDVHNCCGYYPRCVNVGHEPDIEAVQRECREKGIVSVCGFPSITGCRCVEGKCQSMQDGEIV